MSNEYVLAKTGPERNRLMVKLVAFRGHQLLDVRYWYTDSQGDLKPTRKGLSLSGGHYGVVMETLDTYMAPIQAWLSGETEVGQLLDEADANATTEAVKTRQEATRLAYSQSKGTGGAAEAHMIHEPRSRAFFSVDHEGGKERVLYNGHHPFARLVMEAESADEFRALMTDLLAAFHRARHAMEGEDERGTFDLFEHEWAERLGAKAKATLRQGRAG